MQSGLREIVQSKIGPAGPLLAINEIRTMHLGPEDVLVVASVDAADGVPAEELEALTAQFERAITEKFPEVRRLYIETQSNTDHRAAIAAEKSRQRSNTNAPEKKIASRAKKPTAASKRTAAKKTTAPPKQTGPKKKVEPKAQTRKEDTELYRKIESSLKEVSEDASIFASDVADKTSKFAEEIYEKLKKGVSDAYDVSAVVLDDLVQSAEKYADKYKHKVEMRRLNSERNELARELGSIVYARFHQKKAFDSAFFSDKRLNSVLAKIEKLDKDIIKIGKKLDKK